MTDSHDIDPKNTDISPEGLKRVHDSFVKLEQIKDPIHREYELLEAAKRCDLPVDSFRQMFKDYCRQQQESKWMQFPLSSIMWRTELLIEKLNRCLSELDIFPVLDHLSKLSILVALIFYVAESGEREEQKLAQQRRANYEAWNVIRSSENKPGNLGRIEALQDLNKQNPKIALTNVNLAKANLSKIELPNAILDGVDFSQATLHKANLQKSNLTNTNFFKTNLIKSNLQNTDLFGANLKGAELEDANLTGASMGNANLRGANLQKATLKNVTLTQAIYDSKTRFPSNFNPGDYGAVLVQEGANLQEQDFSGQDLADVDFSQANLKKAVLKDTNLRGANLRGTNLDGADLEGADLRKAQGLNVKQIQAAQNWQLANYDLSFRKQLGLSVVK